MTFRPVDETAFNAATALSAEHGRRLVNNTVEVVNERCVQAGSAFRRYNGAGGELRTLWRWSANWGYIGPFHVFASPQVARAGHVRVLIGSRTNEGDGNVRVYAINEAAAPDEETMTENTDSGAPSGEEEWYVCESDAGEGSFDFALKMPVRAGWNRVWIAIKCDADADRTGDIETTASPQFSLQTLGTSVRMPSVGTFSATDPVGATVRLSVSSILYLAGNFDSFTVARIQGQGAVLLSEMSVSEYRDTYSTDFGYAVLSYVVPIYIDSISFDGSVDTSLSGDAFRYRQPVSAGFTRVATDGAQSAHLARLPMSAVMQQLGAEIPVATDATGRLRVAAFISGSTTTIPVALLGLAKATPDVDKQATFSGSWTYEVRFSAYYVAVAVLQARDAIASSFTLAVIDAAGADIVTGDTSVVDVPAYNFSESDVVDPNTSLASLSVVAGRSDWLLESMSSRGELGIAVGVTLRITVTDDLDAEPVQRLVLRVSQDEFSLATVLCASPIAVRLTDGN